MEFLGKFLDKLKGFALIIAVFVICPLLYPAWVKEGNFELFFILYFIYLFLLAIAVVFVVLVRPDVARTLSEGNIVKYDIFISAPMAGFRRGSAEYNDTRNEVSQIVLFLNSKNFKVFCALADDVHQAAFDSPSKTLGENIPALYGTQHYMLILPHQVFTGALVEAGFALALKKPAVIFVRTTEDLPWILQKANDVYPNWEIVLYSDLPQLRQLLTFNLAKYFPGSNAK